MAYVTKYRFEFDTVRNNEIKLDIQEDAFAGAVTNLIGNNISLDYPEGDRSKITGVRKSTLTFDILCSDSLSPEVFITDNDTKFKVILYFNNVINWVGWLDSSALEYSLKDVNYFITLTAKDGLHLLDNADFVELFGVDLWGQYTVFTALHFCLRKTELNLDFWTWINIYPDGYTYRGAGGDTTGENDPFKQIYYDAGTFRTGANEYEDPLSVLEKICATFKLTLFQAKGAWHFVYIEDWVRNNGLTGTHWQQTTDVAVEYVEDEVNQIEIGLDKAYKFFDDNALITIQAAQKSAKINYAFDIPDVVLRNQDLSLGDSQGTFAPYPQYEYFDLYGWTYTGQRPYIFNVITENNVVVDSSKKWVQFIHNSSASTTELISDTIICNASDDFTFSFKQGLTDSINNYRGQLTLDIKVVSSLGTKYLGVDGKWKTTRQNIKIKEGSILIPNGTVIGGFYTHTHPNSYTISTVESIPYTGNLYIIFKHVSPSITYPSYLPFQFIKDIEMQYIGSVGAGLRRDNPLAGKRNLPGGIFYESKEDKVTKNNYSEEVYFINSPNVATQGALFTAAVVPIKNWEHKGVTESVPFGKLISRAVWKFIHRPFYRIEGGFINVSFNNYLITPLFTVKASAMPNKIFCIGTIKIDLKNEKAEGTFVELLDDTNTNDFDEVASIEKMGYLSDFGERIFYGKKGTIDRDPPTFSQGPLGYILSFFNKKQRRSV